MYYPIWRTTKYNSTADTLTYRIVYGEDQVVYTGKAYKIPDENRISINLNGTCRNYINSRIFENVSGIEELEDVVFPMSSSGDFHLEVQSGINWNTVYSWGFVNNWTYDKSVSAITGSIPLSEPINGHASPEMLIPYTHFLSTAPEMSICYSTYPDVDWKATLTPETMDVPPVASSYTAVFSSNVPWTATTDTSLSQYQFQMSPLTGNAGETLLTYTFAQNEDTDTVQCWISFEAYDRTGIAELQYELWQDGCSIDGEFDNHSSAITVPYSATSVTFTVLANCEWEFIGNVTGLTATPWSGTGDGDITVSFSANTGTTRQLSFYIQSYPNGLVTSNNFVINQEREPQNTNKILYTSTDDAVVFLDVTTGWGANIVSNTYINGQGVIEFDGPVTTIPQRAFSGKTTLETISLPDSITDISNVFIFTRCSGLTSVVLPAYVTGRIGQSMFYNCKSLESVNIPYGITEFGSEAFEYCDNLSIIIDLHEGITDIGESCFRGCLKVSFSPTGDLVIPSTMTTVKESAFRDCRGVTGEIIISDNVVLLSDDCFSGCRATSVTVGSSVTEIRHYALAISTLKQIKAYPITNPTVYSDTFHNVAHNGTLYIVDGGLNYGYWMYQPGCLNSEYDWNWGGAPN